MKKIGIKLADGSFYPLLEEGVPGKKKIDLSTIKDNQTTVNVDLYASEKSTMADAILIDTLTLNNLEKQPNGQPDISLSVSIDKNNTIEAVLLDSSSKASARDSIDLHEVLLANDKNPGTGKGLLATAEEINARDASEEQKIASELDDFSFDLPAFSEGPAPQAETVVEEPKAADNFSEPAIADATEVPVDDVPVDDVPVEDVPMNDTLVDDAPVEEENLDLPDFDVPAFTDGGDATQESGESLKFDDNEFEMPDFGGDSADSGASSSSSDDIFGDNSFESSSSDLDFDGLYDEEEKSEEKKTRLPVLICLACAVICVLAVLLLFFLPSKFKLMNSRSETKTEIVKEEAAPLPPPVQKEEPLPPPPPAPAAKEDEIVVIQDAEKVVPDLPKPEKKREPKVITYKIKWGDTLWDISAAYYKNPWRYKKIARYNGIKNPNHIVAGTFIKIPEE